MKMNATDYKTLLNDNQDKGYEHPDIVAKMNSMTDLEIDTFCIYEGYLEDVDRQIVDLWCKLRDRDDGYYPCPVNKPGFDGMGTHIFERDDITWIQITGDSIEGFYSDYGNQLLGLLNNNGKYNCIQICNINGDLIYPSTKMRIVK